jgi:hypothetical protein
MCPENNKDQGDIDKFVEDKLSKVEREICIFVEEEYPDTNIMVSIQVFNSKNSRKTPCNKKCDAARSDPQKLALCELSDIAMKDILWEQVMGIQGPKNTMNGIGYLCHQNLSNIVIPFRGKPFKDWYWYIFLGQFYLLSCDNVSGDKGCIDGIKCGKIDILTENRIPAKFTLCVKPGFFREKHTITDAQIYKIKYLSVPQLLICRYIALRHFRKFLLTMDESDKEKFEKWLEYYANPPEDFPFDKSVSVE